MRGLILLFKALLISPVISALPKELNLMYQHSAHFVNTNAQKERFRIPSGHKQAGMTKLRYFIAGIFIESFGIHKSKCYNRAASERSLHPKYSKEKLRV
ncbi:MAG: hypothetical protein HZA15_06780 [Nitrospirae bacterium]|nr:hypothetical protein [Nitrospirota bacterium]